MSIFRRVGIFFKWCAKPLILFIVYCFLFFIVIVFFTSMSVELKGNETRIKLKLEHRFQYSSPEGTRGSDSLNLSSFPLSVL